MNIRQAHRPQIIRGFTLVEIMVVIVIIGLILGIVAPGIINQLSRAEVQAAEADIQVLGDALDLFRIDHYRYPSTDEGLEILLGDTEIDGKPVIEYVRSVPEDPWGRPYHYENPGTHGDRYDLYSYGADGEEGGEDVNADIGSWDLN